MNSKRSQFYQEFSLDGDGYANFENLFFLEIHLSFSFSWYFFKGKETFILLFIESSKITLHE